MHITLQKEQRCSAFQHVSPSWHGVQAPPQRKEEISHVSHASGLASSAGLAGAPSAHPVVQEAMQERGERVTRPGSLPAGLRLSAEWSGSAAQPFSVFILVGMAFRRLPSVISHVSAMHHVLQAVLAWQGLPAHTQMCKKPCREAMQEAMQGRSERRA